MAHENVPLPGSDPSREPHPSNGASEPISANNPGLLIQTVVRTVAGLLLVLLIQLAVILPAYGLVVWLEKELTQGIGLFVGLGAIGILVLVFCWIERNFWLSRLLGLRIPAHKNPLGRAILWAIAGPLTLLIFLQLVAQPRHAGARATEATRPTNVDSTREIVETVVFVVVLVLLLKSFVAEAFVIPTGSMADTLWGYQKYVTCPQCTHGFPVNSSQEADPQDGGRATPVTGCICPNCRLPIRLVDPRDPNRPSGSLAADEIPDPGFNSGDRVLVVKYIYDLVPGTPDRFDVVVFKFPGDTSPTAGYRRFPVSGPQQNWTQMNYIKRLIGLPGETIGIWYGDLYRWHGEQPSANDERIPKRDRWQKDYMHENEVQGLLEGGKHFEILRKSPDKILAMRRLVYDNDQPAKDLEGVLPPRWAGEEVGAWPKAEPHGFRHTPGDTDRLRWLRYRHILRPTAPRRHEDVEKKPEPELITDFLGYNSYTPRRDGGGTAAPNWAGDLLLECEVQIEDAKGELVLELSRGVDRFRARFELDSGKCTLLRLKRPHEGATPPADDDFEPLDEQKGTALTTLKKKGTYRLRFANVDAQLVLWVDGSLVFGNGLTYELPAKRGPYANDLEPASIGVKGGTVSVHQLKLWRDTYYTTNPGSADGAPEGGDWSSPKKWDPLRSLSGKTLYAQPDHYICLGDNSPESSDSRAWGAVPQRLMLGRALVVYYPFYFPWWPLKSPVNRVGPIR